MIISLDLGTKLGYYKEGDTEAHTVIFTKDDRFYEFFLFLDDIIANNPVDKILYEEAKFQIGNAIPIYHGFVGILKVVTAMHKIKLDYMHTKSVKKFFCGNGNANKQDVMAKCKEHGIDFNDDNSADAYAVYYTYVNTIKEG